MIFNRPVIYGTSYRGRLYVGQHIGDGSDYVGSGVIIKDIKKSGNENKLITGVIEYIDDIKKLDEREIHWIEKLKPELNLTKGGETWGIGKDNIMNRPEVKKKFIGDNNPMRRPEVAKKVSEAFKKFGENHWNKKPEMRKRLSEQKKGVPMLKIRGVNHPFCKDPSKVFISFRDQHSKLKWLVRVPNKGYKSFEKLEEAKKHRDILIGVN